MSEARPRQLRLGVALVAILAIGLVLGLIAKVRRDARRERHAHEQLTLQSNVTQALLVKAREDLVPRGGSSRSSQMGVGGSHLDWHATMKDVELPGRTLIHLEVWGSIERGDLQPIRIIRKPGELHPEVIKRLTDEYRKRGWRYVVEGNAE